MNIINDKVMEYINSFYKPVDEDTATLRAECETDGVPLILKETEIFFNTLLRIINPKRILEIGAARGYSSIYFSRVCPQASITTLERDERMISACEKAFSKYDQKKAIELIPGDALASLNRLSEEVTSGQRSSYDFIFIDAGKSHYTEFFDAAEGMLSDDGIVVCDNVLFRAYVADEGLAPNRRHKTNIKNMRAFLEYINERDDLTASLVASGDGIAIIKRRENH